MLLPSLVLSFSQTLPLCFSLSTLSLSSLTPSTRPPPLPQFPDTLPPQQPATEAHIAETRLARRIYVGGLPTHVPLNEGQLLGFFQEVVKEQGVSTPCPIISVWKSGDGKFAVGFFFLFFSLSSLFALSSSSFSVFFSFFFVSVLCCAFFVRLPFTTRNLSALTVSHNMNNNNSVS